MVFLLALGLCSILCSLIATPLCRNILLRMGLVDVPDNVRKLHSSAVPRMGGVAVFGSYVAAIAIAIPVASALPSKMLPSEIPGSLGIVLQLLPAAAIVFLTGVLDDLYTLRPWQKLAGQVAAAGLACYMGVRIETVHGHTADQWFGVPLTMLWLLGCTNAFNLIDGVDGLATGAGLFAATSIFLTALLQGNLGLAVATIPMAGALLGFLRYNFNPASIFLGDCGSLVIGFMLGSYAVVWCQKSATLVDMTAPLMALALPLLDTTLAIVRRFIHNKPIFAADRGHIHHRLLDRGHAPRQVTLRLYAACGIAAVFSLVQGIFPGHGVLFLVLFSLVIGLGVRYLDYVEFAIIGRLFTGGTIRQIVQEEVRLHQFEEDLKKAGTIEELWAVIQHSCAALDIAALEWNCCGELYQMKETSAVDSLAWTTMIAFPAQGHLYLNRHPKCLLTPRLVELLRIHLAPEAAPPNTRMEIRSHADCLEAVN